MDKIFQSFTKGIRSKDQCPKFFFQNFENSKPNLTFFELPNLNYLRNGSRYDFLGPIFQSLTKGIRSKDQCPKFSFKILKIQKLT